MSRSFQTFVVPYDFSEHARAALQMAIDLAQRFESDLHLVHVIQPPALAYAAYGVPGMAAPPVGMLELREIAECTLRRAPCAVLTVQAPDGAEPAAHA